MAGALEGIANAVSQPLQGVLDFRQTLINQRNDILNPLVNQVLQQRQQQQNNQAQDAVRFALGQTGQGQTSEEGFYTDLGPARGLLADPRFADNKSELVFASELFGDASTRQAGASILSNILSAQQQVDVAQQAQQADLQAAARDQFEKNRNVANAIADDIRRELGPAASQLSGLQGLYDNLAASDPQAALASVIQFMQTLDPSSVVREGEQVQVRRTGGAADSLVGLVQGALGGSPLTASQRIGLANAITRVMKPRIQQFQDVEQGFQRQIEAAQLGRAQGVAEAAFPLLRQPVVPDILQGQAGATIQAPVPEGLTPGRAPRAGPNTRGSRRGQ